MDQLYTITEVAQVLRVKRQTIYRWIAEGRIKTVAVGAHIRVTREAIEAFVAQSTQERQARLASEASDDATIDTTRVSLAAA